MMASKISPDNYLYHCVPAISLPAVTHEVQISSSSSSSQNGSVGNGGGGGGVVTEVQHLGEMINILSPILNMEEKSNGEHHHHNGHHHHHHLSQLSHHHHHHLFNSGTLINKGDTTYTIIEGDLINHHSTIKLEVDESMFQKLSGGNGVSNGGSSSTDSPGSPETEMKRAERLQKDIFRKKMARLRESDDQRVERLKKDRIRKKRARQNESQEQRQRRLEKDRVRIQKRRAVETDDERQRRLEKNRISKRKARLKENALMQDLDM